MPDGEKLLKRGLHRSVWLSASGEVVIKRFRSQSAWRRATDGRRARREARMLLRLAELGLSVPRVVALDRAQAGWELRISAIRRARSLDDRLNSADRAEVDAAGLGSALARFHAVGFLHGDLHPGNLLAEEDREWFLIDVASGSIRTPADRTAALRELIGLLAAVRERTTVAWRAELFEAWNCALPRVDSADAANAWEPVELESRRARQRSVLAHADRWLRASSRLQLVESGAETWLVNASHPHARDLLATLHSEALDSPTTVARMGDRVSTISGPAARERWIHVARAFEHALPGLQPLAWNAARSLAMLEARGTNEPRALRRDDPGAAELADALADRGLWTSSPPLVERAADGRLVLSPEWSLPTKFVPGPTDDALRTWFAKAPFDAARGHE